MSLLALLPSRPWAHLKVSPGVWFFMNRYAAQPDSAAHDHNYLELAFIMKGRARHYTVRGETGCRPGDIYIIPVGAWHGYARCEDLEVFNCLLSPALLGNELAWIANDESWRGLLEPHPTPGGTGIRKRRATSTQMDRLRERLESLLAAHDRQASRTEMLGHLMLLLEIVRASRRTGDTTTSTKPGHPAVRRALEALHGDIAREWTLPAVAEVLKLNPSYLVRIFRAETGRSPMKYLDGIRAEQAAGLLLSTRLRIGEIGPRVGWPDPKQFARAFQRQFNLSASVYRRRMTRAFAPRK
ncbi:MAG: AraC family transcriptional regulator [Verrucomicrobiota bacterium]